MFPLNHMFAVAVFESLISPSNLFQKLVHDPERTMPPFFLDRLMGEKHEENPQQHCLYNVEEKHNADSFLEGDW